MKVSWDRLKISRVAVQRSIAFAALVAVVTMTANIALSATADHDGEELNCDSPMAQAMVTEAVRKNQLRLNLSDRLAEILRTAPYTLSKMAMTTDDRALVSPGITCEAWVHVGMPFFTFLKPPEQDFKISYHLYGDQNGHILRGSPGGPDGPGTASLWGMGQFYLVYPASTESAK